MVRHGPPARPRVARLILRGRPPTGKSALGDAPKDRNRRGSPCPLCIKDGCPLLWESTEISMGSTHGISISRCDRNERNAAGAQVGASSLFPTDTLESRCSRPWTADLRVCKVRERQ